MRPLQPYEPWIANVQLLGAVNVGANAPDVSKRKWLTAGQGRLYVNEAAADIIRQIIAVVTGKRQRALAGLTIPVATARKIAEILRVLVTSQDVRFN